MTSKESWPPGGTAASSLAVGGDAALGAAYGIITKWADLSRGDAGVICLNCTQTKMK